MKIEHLRDLLTVAECGSISKAAEKLFMTQPHLSQNIRAIENEMNFKIFIRRSDGVVLSEKGKKFMLYAQRMINEMDKMIEIFGQQQNNIPTFRVSSVRSSLVMDTFLEFLDAYNNYPESKFYLCEVSQKKVLDDVYTQSSEVGVIYLLKGDKKDFINQIAGKRMAYTPICDLERQVILSKNHPLLLDNKPITTKRLSNYGLVRYGGGSLFGSESADDLWYNTFVDQNKIGKKIYIYDRASLHNILTQTTCFTVGTDPSIKQEKVHHIVSVVIDGCKDGQMAEMGYVHLESMPLSPYAQQFVSLLEHNYSKVKL